MALLSTARHNRRRTGNYLAIYASAIATLLLGCLLAEQIGVDGQVLNLSLFWLPLLAFAGVGLCIRADDPREFFTADRKVTSPYIGAALAVTALGGSGLAGVTGSLMLVGNDALVLGLGWVSGLIISGIMLFPFLRKCGAYTVPGYLGLRLDSRFVRMISAVAMLAASLLLVAAEVRAGAFAAGLMTGLPDVVCVGSIAVAATAAVAIGGLRGLTWVTVIQAITVLAAIAVPVTIVSLMVSNVPFPQLTHGNVLQVIRRTEVAQAFPPLETGSFHFYVPGAALETFSNAFIQSFGHVGRAGYPFAILVIATGVAVMPTLLNRAGSASSVYESRKSCGWAVVFASFMLLTMAAIAVFLRSAVVDQIVGASTGKLPAWFQVLRDTGLAAVAQKKGVVSLQDIAMKRDAAFMALPIAAGLPITITALAVAGLAAAALAAAAAQINTIAGMISEDLIHVGRSEIPPDTARMFTGRVAAVTAGGLAFLGGWMVSDPLATALAAIALLAATTFPVLVLSILWRKVSRTAAIAGMSTGFGLTVTLMLGSVTGLLALHPVMAAAIGGPANFLVLTLVSQVAPLKSKRAMEVVHDLRLPGGEATYDRETRLQRRKRATAQV